MTSALKAAFLLTCLASVGGHDSCDTQVPKSASGDTDRVHRFQAMGGRAQVQEFFRIAPRPELLGGLSPGEGNVEQEILLTSADPAIETALASETRSGDSKKASFAVYLLCLRASFVPQSEFAIPEVSGEHWSKAAPYGLFTPFGPNLARLNSDANQALRDPLASPDLTVRVSAQLNCGAFETEVSSASASELAASWRREIDLVKYPMYIRYDRTEHGERARILERVLEAKGVSGAVAVGELLRQETKPWARQLEEQLIVSIDAESVRLRGSPEGRQVIQWVGEALESQEFFYERTQGMRHQEWSRLQARFFQDENFDIGGGWRLLALAFKDFYGDSLSLRNQEELKRFITYLSETDPAFPSWEYPSSIGFDHEMLHPRYREKVRRYHDAWLQFQSLKKILR